ncbi:MAG TPA: cell division protein FtsQ, partial [Acetobacteraceae bacterium]
LRMASGVDVMLPEGHEIAALDRLMRLQQDHALLDRPLIAIDMRLPDRLVVRPRPEPHSDAVSGSKLPTPPASIVPVTAKKAT